MAKYQYTVEGTDYDVEILEIEDNVAKVNVNGAEFVVELKQALKPTTRPIKQGVAPEPKPAAPAAAATAATVQQPAAAPAGAGRNICAPLPGTIIDIKVKVGDQVKEGDTLLILEAMKMQNNIEAEVSGQVTAILVKPGDSVMEGTALVTIA